MFINTIKRKPVWITWLLFLFTCSCFIIILPALSTMSTFQLWANTTMTICQTFMGMIAALFTSVLAINIYKESNEEGTELIIISKPISRTKIVLTKFIVFGVFCLLVNLTAVLLSAFTILLPNTEPKFYWGLVVSMLIGNFVVFGVFGSIAILMTLKFQKVGVIVTNVIISLVFLIYQSLTLFVFSTPGTTLVDNNMTPLSYIITNRDRDTGKYEEDHVVVFNATPTKDHPYQGTTWQDLVKFWKENILPKDPTPILNVTDLAGQLSLTYMSYNLNGFSDRQAARSFGLSRYYDYELTSPMSPEIIMDGKKTLPWIYTSESKYQIDEYFSLIIPGGFGFAGINPVGSTRARGYTDKIPVGFINSKDSLFSEDVFFEPDDYVKYKDGFDAIYDNIYNPSLYSDQVEGVDYLSTWAANQKNLAFYYELMWNTLLNKISNNNVIANGFDFNIHNVKQLNERFLQYKYYAYTRVLDEQQYWINNPTENEKLGIQEYIDWYQIIDAMFGTKHNLNTWMVQGYTDPENTVIQFLEPGTQTLSYAMLEEVTSWLDVEEMQTSSLAHIKKTESIFNNTCAARESYLFDSIDQFSRGTAYQGRAYMIDDTWVPYILTLLSVQHIEDAPNTPVGQNMRYFFYTATPKVKYWIYAVIWTIIASCAFAAGAIAYSRYDVK